MDTPRNPNDPHVMTEWIHHLQTWLEDHSSERKHSDDSLSSDAGNDSSL